MSDNLADIAMRAAFLRQRRAEIADAGIVHTRLEIEKDAERSEIVQLFRSQSIDIRELPIAQQAGPVIVCANLHPAFVLPDRRRRQFARRRIVVHVLIAMVGVIDRRGVAARIIRSVLVICSFEFAAQSVHDVACPCPLPVLAMGCGAAW